MRPLSFDCAKEPLDEGVCLLEASAGTGKTFALARIFLRLVAEHGLEVSKILVVTFTTAATEELRGRIRELLVEALELLQGEGCEIEDETIRQLANSGSNKDKYIRRIRLAITCFDEAVIHTIHGFCNRVLAENSLETHALFEAELDQSADDLITEAMHEYWRCSMADVHPVVAASASVSRLGPDELVKFYKSLPVTRSFQMGFGQGEDPALFREQLILGFELLKDSWIQGRDEYFQFIEKCVNKRNRAYTQSDRHARLLDDLLVKQSISPSGIEVLREIRSSKLSVRKEFINDPRPQFSRQAEEFCLALDRFFTIVRIDGANYLRKRIEEWKNARGLLSFDDLLRLTADAVTRKTEAGESLRQSLRTSFEAALIDEFQDTDPVQFKIFQELFGSSEKHRMYLIGDPKQSIYRFRGADIEAYFEFARATGAKTYSLDKNFRTTSSLVRGVNQFLSAPAESPFLHPQLPFHPVNPNLGGSADQNKLFQFGENSTPSFVIRELQIPGDRRPNKSITQGAIRIDMANEIFDLLNDGRVGGKEVNPGDIAVLVRSNSEAREVWEYFCSRGLPAVVFSDMSLFETEESRELCWVLQGLSDAQNDRSIRRALATGLLGMSSDDFQGWKDDPAEWERWVGQFRGIRKTWREQGIYVALRKLFRETGAIERNLKRPDGERRVTNFLHLSEVLHQATANNPMSPSSLVVWLRAKMDQKNRSNEEYQLRLESESAAIRILTVHKSKGLEYPITFLPFLGFSTEPKKGAFTYHDNDGQLTVGMRELANDEDLNRGYLAESREDARVLYVGLTRASSRCYLYHLPEVGTEQVPPSAQGRILQEITKSSSAGGIAGWIEHSGLNEEITHDYLSLNPTERGVRNGQTAEFRIAPDSLLSEVFPRGRTLPTGNRIESFSSLTKQVDFNGFDLDGVSVEEGEKMDGSISDDLIYKFPAGANAGNFMHDLFEHLSFDDSSGWEEMVGSKLEDHQFDSLIWKAPILKMVSHVMTVDLFPGFSLSSLSTSDRMEEMEFLFPSASTELSKLGSILPDDSQLKKYLSRVDGSEWAELEKDGYLTGLVDLVFRDRGRYYILDWKSNLLSGRVDGFEQAAVEQEMHDHHYILQYHLYVLAIYKFLKSRIPGFSYERDFGGVYYLFTRGIRPSSNRGIFFDLPSLSVVSALEDTLCSPVPSK